MNVLNRLLLVLKRTGLVVLFIVLAYGLVTIIIPALYWIITGRNYYILFLDVGEEIIG